MKRIQSFIGLTLLGGFMVILPAAIFVLLVGWVGSVIITLLSPLSSWIASWTPLAQNLAEMASILMILCGFFMVGLLVRTRIGLWLRDVMEHWLSRLVPGYKAIREMVTQFVGGEGNASLLRGQVCRAYLHGRAAGVSVTGIVTANHANGDYTVYVPTAPIPTSGFVYHLSNECVDLLPHIGVEAAMRTVIACGSGSQIISEPPSDSKL